MSADKKKSETQTDLNLISEYTPGERLVRIQNSFSEFILLTMSDYKEVKTSCFKKCFGFYSKTIPRNRLVTSETRKQILHKYF